MNRMVRSMELLVVVGMMFLHLALNRQGKQDFLDHRKLGAIAAEQVAPMTWGGRSSSATSRLKASLEKRGCLENQ